MSVERIPELKRGMLQMEDTNEESDNLIKNPELMEDSFEKIRQKIHWKITFNEQVDFIGNYILYELLKTTKHYDLYRGIKISNKEMVIVKIIDKSTIKLGLIENEFLLNWQDEYQEFIQKLQIEHEASQKLMNSVSSIFLVKNHEIYENQYCILKITENYYDEPLSKILMRRGSLPIEEALAIIKQIIFTLSELHKQNIILTELNPDVIIYRNGVFKITDFSSMRKVGNGFSSTLNLLHGYTYENLIAPELKVCPEIVDIKSQIWAIGILFYQMIAYNIPYEQRGINIVKKAKAHNITIQTRTGQVSDSILNFMRQVLETSPDQRISWKKLLNHPIFDNKQYFSRLKIIPIVDIRSETFKKKEKDTILEEMYTNDFVNSPNKKRKFISKIKELNNKVLFKVVDEDKRINISRCLDIEEETFFFIQQTNLMALKAMYIYHEILLKIKSYHLIDTKRRSHIQTIFLIAQRCFQYIRRSKTYESKKGDLRIENYLEQIKKIFQEIKQFYIQTRQQYQSIDKSTYYISNDIFSSFLSNSKNKQRSKMLKGKEGVDYTLEDNVKFTQEKCINRILPEIKGDGMMKDQITILECLKLNLINYQKINRITLEDLKTEHSFPDVVTKIITAKNTLK